MSTNTSQDTHSDSSHMYCEPNVLDSSAVVCMTQAHKLLDYHRCMRKENKDTDMQSTSLLRLMQRDGGLGSCATLQEHGKIDIAWYTATFQLSRCWTNTPGTEQLGFIKAPGCDKRLTTNLASPFAACDLDQNFAFLVVCFKCLKDCLAPPRSPLWSCNSHTLQAWIAAHGSASEGGMSSPAPSVL